MTRGWRCRFAILWLSLTACLPCASSAQAQILWADWQSQTGGARADGVVGTIAVSVTGPLSPTPLLGPESEPNYWAAFPSSYAAPTAGVPTAPTARDMIRVSGGATPTVYTLTFSQPVTNPVMAIASLGAPPTPTRFDFGSQPVVLLHQGPGAWGAGTLTQIGNSLEGREGNGVIRLSGTMTQIVMTMPTPEVWTGFTVGIEASGSPVPPVANPGVAVGLSWDYPNPIPAESGMPLGFRLYRDLGDGPCADVAPLSDLVGEAPAAARSYHDRTISVMRGTVCYEVSAYNEAGESAHSNRAAVQVEALIPAMPGTITVQAMTN